MKGYRIVVKKSMDKHMKSDQVTIEMLENELSILQYRKMYCKEMLHTIYVLVVIAAIAILLAMLVFPVVRITGKSMTPTYQDDDLVLALNSRSYSQGDIIIFHYNNQLLIKRVIALEGQWVKIDEGGNVYVDDFLLEEDYIEDKALGKCDIEMPYQVPSGKCFVMGDHRSTSMDSRMEVIGCVDLKQVVGRILFKIWPI